jgi:hypothetical protein
LEPQHQTVPSSSTAHEAYGEVDIATALVIPRTRAGAVAGTLVILPHGITPSLRNTGLRLSSATLAATPAATRRHPLDCLFFSGLRLARRALRRRIVSSPFDQFAKDVLDLLLSAHGRLETEVEAPALKSQRADVMFDPDPSHNAARRALGLLGVMTDRCCFFDPFHEAPDVAEVRSCLRKILNHQHARALGHRPAAEVSWLLCGGRPDSALGAMPFAPSTGWPRGFYDLGAALPLSIVVLSELPETADTLALRLMGAGLTLRRAISDLQQTPPGAVRDALVRRVVELHHDREVRDPHAPEYEDELMRSLPFVEELERRCRTEGAHLALVRYVERSLGRVTTEAERDALRHGLMRRGDAMLDEVFALSPAALDAWLIRQPS